jgi:transposase
LEFLQHLLPDPTHLQLEAWDLDRTNRHLSLTVSSTQISVPCSVCQGLSQRVHSRYERTLQDLPCVNYSMSLLLLVRKFFCINTGCSRRIFTERLPTVTAPWARRTYRLAQRLIATGLALGGAAGARLSHQWSSGVSDSALLSLLSKQALPPIAPVKTVGVDDFAFRKGQNYGMILVDLDRHRPIALLKDREANTLAESLQQHPGVQVRFKRSLQVIQTRHDARSARCDSGRRRFHLLQNLAEVLERFLGTQSKALKAVDLAYHRELGKTFVTTPPKKPPTIQQQRAQQRRERRLNQYEAIHKLRQQGVTVLDIAHHLGMGERTVFRYLAAPSFPEWQPHPRRPSKSLLSPYKPYLLAQWNAGQRQTKRLFAQIQQQGYKGSYMTVTRYTHQLRQAQRQQLSTLEGRGHAPPFLSSGGIGGLESISNTSVTTFPVKKLPRDSFRQRKKLRCDRSLRL